MRGVSFAPLRRGGIAVDSVALIGRVSRIKRGFCALVVLLSVSLPASAAVLTVGASGCDYTTLDAAIAAANPGDELRLRAQTFTGVNELITDSLTIRGGYNVCGDAFPGIDSVSVLEGTGTENLLSIGGGATTTVELIRLEMTGGGGALFGGAVAMLSGATLRLATVEIHNNEADFGGAIYVGGDSVLEHTGPVTLRDNVAEKGGALYVAGDGVADFTTTGFNPVDVTGNLATEGGGIYVGDGGALRTDADHELSVEGNQAQAGGGLFAETSATLHLVGDRVRNNLASIAGGGLFVAGDGNGAATPTILIEQDTSFHSNEAGVGGGIAFGPGGGFNVVMDARLTNNTASQSGGGLHVAGNGVLNLDGSSFGGNDAGTNGGGAYLNSSVMIAEVLSVNANEAGLDGGGLYMTGRSSLQVGTRLSASGNTAQRSGGGVAIQGGSFLQVDGGTQLRAVSIMNNEATTGDGGGLYLVDASVDLGGARIGEEGEGNVAVEGRGGGAFIDTDLAWGIRNFWINNNRAGFDGGGLFIVGDADFELGGIAVGGPVPRGTEACLLMFREAGEYCAEVRGNTADIGGGGIVVSGTSSANRRIHDLAIVDNVSGNPAAGLWMDAPGVELQNVLIARNSGSAAAFLSVGFDATLQHVSVLFNERGIQGGGSESFAIDNSLFWGNGGVGFNPGSGSVVTGDCNLGQGFLLPGVFRANPRLISTERGLYRLSDQSPARDACANALLVDDLDGVERPNGAAHDAGAFEGGWGTSEILLSDSFEVGPLASPRL